MIRRTQGSFAVAHDAQGRGGRVNLSDAQFVATASAGYPQYTVGMHVLTSVQLFPATSDECKIISFTVIGRMLLGISTAANAAKSPLFGRLGRIVAGLTTTGTESNLAAPLPQGGALPSDLSLTGDLWNPANDPLPPMFVGDSGGPDAIPPADTPVGLQIGLSLTLPQALPVPEGQNIFIGMWMQPSLSVCQPGGTFPSLRPTVLDAIYSLVYDDGGAPPP